MKRNRLPRLERSLNARDTWAMPWTIRNLDNTEPGTLSHTSLGFGVGPAAIRVERSVRKCTWFRIVHARPHKSSWPKFAITPVTSGDGCSTHACGWCAPSLGISAPTNLRLLHQPQRASPLPPSQLIRICPTISTSRSSKPQHTEPGGLPAYPSPIRIGFSRWMSP